MRGDRRHHWFGFCEFSGGPRPAARPVFVFCVLLHTPFVWPSSALFATAAFRSAAIGTGELPHSASAFLNTLGGCMRCLLRSSIKMQKPLSHAPTKVAKNGRPRAVLAGALSRSKPGGRVAWRQGAHWRLARRARPATSSAGLRTLRRRHTGTSPIRHRRAAPTARSEHTHPRAAGRGTRRPKPNK